MRHVIYGIGFAVLFLAAVPAHATDHVVHVGGASVRFDPAELTIAPGDTVTWVSNSAQAHNVLKQRGAAMLVEVGSDFVE